MLPLVVLGVCTAYASVLGAEREEQWVRDVTDSISIGAALSGYQNVDLLCGADHMLVQVHLDADFHGVLYTRGAFHSRQEPCFLDATGGRNFTLRLPFHSCNTRTEGKVHTNTIVVQHDDELVMPGDAAFRLDCDFTNRKEFTLTAGLEDDRTAVTSRITLTDADPAVKDLPPNQIISVSMESDRVTFTPQTTEQRRDEL